MTGYSLTYSDYILYLHKKVKIETVCKDIAKICQQF